MPAALVQQRPTTQTADLNKNTKTTVSHVSKVAHHLFFSYLPGCCRQTAHQKKIVSRASQRSMFAAKKKERRAPRSYICFYYLFLFE